MILLGNYIFQLGIEHNWQLLYKRTCQICADSGNCPANFHFQSKCQSFKILNTLLCRQLQGNECMLSCTTWAGRTEKMQQFHAGHSTVSCGVGWTKSSAQKVRSRGVSLVVMQPKASCMKRKQTFMPKNRWETIKDAELKVWLHQVH